MSAPEAGARGRILDIALKLMSERGSTATSMRQLATACGLNVATLYHYFPSKADLLRAVIEERRYGERLATQQPLIDPGLPPRERFIGLLRWVWEQTEPEHSVIRLILGEAVRGDITAQQSARSLLEVLDDVFGQWMADGFPELTVDPADAGRLVRRQLLALVTERLAAGRSVSGSGAADELATALFD